MAYFPDTPFVDDDGFVGCPFCDSPDCFGECENDERDLFDAYLDKEEDEILDDRAQDDCCNSCGGYGCYGECEDYDLDNVGNDDEDDIFDDEDAFDAIFDNLTDDEQDEMFGGDEDDDWYWLLLENKWAG